MRFRTAYALARTTNAIFDGTTWFCALATGIGISFIARRTDRTGWNSLGHVDGAGTYRRHNHTILLPRIVVGYFSFLMYNFLPLCCLIVENRPVHVQCPTGNNMAIVICNRTGANF
ncbi:hypothetical protein D3C81_1684850 [compost metagenome]